MKRFNSLNTLLLIGALPLTLIPRASGAGIEINQDGDEQLTTDDQRLDLRTLTTLPLKLILLASQTGLEITSSDEGEVIVDSNNEIQRW
jgi:hypothetical protein